MEVCKKLVYTIRTYPCLMQVEIIKAKQTFLSTIVVGSCGEITVSHEMTTVSLHKAKSHVTFFFHHLHLLQSVHI